MPCKGIADFYRVGDEMGTFMTPEDFLERYRFHRSHPSKRECMTLAGHSRAQQCNTRVDIARQLLA